MTNRVAQIARVIVGAFIVSALSGNKYAEAQSGTNVLIVQNDTTTTGEAIAKRYAERRAVPADNVCHLNTTDAETISRLQYEEQIEQPIWRCIAGKHGQDRILYIVLTKGIPIRIDGTGGRSGTVSSVDSELTLLYRRRSGLTAPVVGSVPNPYFAGGAAASTLKPFSHQLHDIFLVTRLDGYTLKDALALVDRGAAPVKEGRIILDERFAWTDTGNAWLRAAAEKLKAQNAGDRVLLDESSNVVTGEQNVLGYYSWGSNDPAIRVRRFGFGFVPGALAAMFVSTDARTFKEPPANWLPSGDASRRESIFGGSHQSLVADLIRDGITGTAGHVAEPYLDATIRPDILFPAYLSGLNLAEAFYAAMPYLSWQTIVLGDPLCAPFREKTLAPEEINVGIDTGTELPAYFAGRRLARITGLKPEAATAFVRAETRKDLGNVLGAIESLEAAVASEPRYTSAHSVLADMYESAGQFDKAIAQYEAILAYAPNEPLPLNNLAYALAVRRNAPQDALKYAERVVKIQPESPHFLDTLAWVQHLLGHDRDAAPVIARAVGEGPNIPEIRWHAALIYTAINEPLRAAIELDAALKMNPNVASEAEIKALRAQLLKRAAKP